MDPLIHTLAHLHADMATTRLLLELLEENTTPHAALRHRYSRAGNALHYAIRQLRLLLDLLQEDEHPGPTPTERSPTECPTTCPRPSSPSSPSPSSLALLSSPPTSAATSTDADPTDTRSPSL